MLHLVSVCGTTSCLILLSFLSSLLPFFLSSPPSFLLSLQPSFLHKGFPSGFGEVTTIDTRLDSEAFRLSNELLFELQCAGGHQGYTQACLKAHEMSGGSHIKDTWSITLYYIHTPLYSQGLLSYPIGDSSLWPAFKKI